MLTLSTVTPAALVAQSLDAVRAELGPVAAVPDGVLHRIAEREIRWERERRAPEAPTADLRVVEYMDFFKLRDAPYVLEERVGESGRSYTVKVYLPEAYTAAYMIPSDETGRLVRWGVKLNDGRIVSRDGIFRLRFPAAWERIKAKAARARGEARDKLLGEALWGLLTPEEQRAMIASVNVRDFADGRGEKQALADLEDFLKREGSLLAYADHEWWRDISADYSTRLLGGPVGSPAWLGASFAEFTPYKQERAGRPREDLSPETMPATQSAGKGYIIHPAITDPEYWTPPGKDHPRRAADKTQVFPILRRRFGSALARMAQDRAARLHNGALPADLPSEYTVEGRLARQAMYAEILRTIDPAWAKDLGPSDRMLEPLLNAATRVFMGTPPPLWSAPEAPARAPEPEAPTERVSALALQLDRLGLPGGMIVPTTYRGRVTVRDGRLGTYLIGIRHDYYGDVGALLDLPLYASPDDPEPIRTERDSRMEREAVVLAVPGRPDWSRLVVDPKAAHPSDYFYQNVIPADQEDTVRGVFAGYNGKRRMSDDQLYKRSSAFIEGYQSGRQQREKATQPLPPPWKPSPR